MNEIDVINYWFWGHMVWAFFTVATIVAVVYLWRRKPVVNNTVNIDAGGNHEICAGDALYVKHSHDNLPIGRVVSANIEYVPLIGDVYRAKAETILTNQTKCGYIDLDGKTYPLVFSICGWRAGGWYSFKDERIFPDDPKPEGKHIETDIHIEVLRKYYGDPNLFEEDKAEAADTEPLPKIDDLFRADGLAIMENDTDSHYISVPLGNGGKNRFPLRFRITGGGGGVYDIKEAEKCGSALKNEGYCGEISLNILRKYFHLESEDDLAYLAPGIRSYAMPLKGMTVYPKNLGDLLGEDLNREPCVEDVWTLKERSNGRYVQLVEGYSRNPVKIRLLGKTRDNEWITTDAGDSELGPKEPHGSLMPEATIKKYYDLYSCTMKSGEPTPPPMIMKTAGKAEVEEVHLDKVIEAPIDRPRGPISETVAQIKERISKVAFAQWRLGDLSKDTPQPEDLWTFKSLPPFAVPPRYVELHRGYPQFPTQVKVLRQMVYGQDLYKIIDMGGDSLGDCKTYSRVIPLKVLHKHYNLMARLEEGSEDTEKAPESSPAPQIAPSKGKVVQDWLLACDRCMKRIIQPGALVFAPPVRDMTLKFHICQLCWNDFVGNPKYFLENLQKEMEARLKNPLLPAWTGKGAYHLGLDVAKKDTPDVTAAVHADIKMIEDSLRETLEASYLGGDFTEVVKAIPGVAKVDIKQIDVDIMLEPFVELGDIKLDLEEVCCDNGTFETEHDCQKKDSREELRKSLKKAFEDDKCKTGLRHCKERCCDPKEWDANDYGFPFPITDPRHYRTNITPKTLIKLWNEHFPIGTAVLHFYDTQSNKRRQEFTNSPAAINQFGDPIVHLKGSVGFRSLWDLTWDEAYWAVDTWNRENPVGCKVVVYPDGINSTSPRSIHGRTLNEAFVGEDDKAIVPVTRGPGCEIYFAEVVNIEPDNSDD